jgi:hypothetical protein
MRFNHVHGYFKSTTNMRTSAIHTGRAQMLNSMTCHNFCFSPMLILLVAVAVQSTYFKSCCSNEVDEPLMNYRLIANMINSFTSHLYGTGIA